MDLENSSSRCSVTPMLDWRRRFGGTALVVGSPTNR